MLEPPVSDQLCRASFKASKMFTKKGMKDSIYPMKITE